MVNYTQLSLTFARLVAFETQIFEIVHPLGVHELYELACRPAVCVTQLTLERYVVVLCRTARESMLKKND